MTVHHRIPVADPVDRLRNATGEVMGESRVPLLTVLNGVLRVGTGRAQCVGSTREMS